jgi:hypothetical protein
MKTILRRFILFSSNKIICDSFDIGIRIPIPNQPLISIKNKLHIKKPFLLGIVIFLTTQLVFMQWLSTGATTGPIYYNGVGFGTTSPSAKLTDRLSTSLLSRNILGTKHFLDRPIPKVMNPIKKYLRTNN